MAKVFEPTATQLKEWDKWVKSRPISVRKIAERLNPWTLYRMKDTGQRCTIASIYENGTISVNITGDFNVVLFDANVFGIAPDTLEECDLPDAEECVGAALSPMDVAENLDALRVTVRPDLFVLDENGKAVRKQ